MTLYGCNLMDVVDHESYIGLAVVHHHVEMEQIHVRNRSREYACVDVVSISIVQQHAIELDRVEWHHMVELVIEVCRESNGFYDSTFSSCSNENG